MPVDIANLRCESVDQQLQDIFDSHLASTKTKICVKIQQEISRLDFQHSRHIRLRFNKAFVNETF